jgi:hypothetical protein
LRVVLGIHSVGDHLLGGHVGRRERGGHSQGCLMRRAKRGDGARQVTISFDVSA